MNNRLCQMFGIEAPIFAFSHCRDVVVEVSKAGGLGVLIFQGISRNSDTMVLVGAILISAIAILTDRLIDRFGVTNKAAYASIPAWSLVLALPFFLGFAAADSGSRRS